MKRDRAKERRILAEKVNKYKQGEKCSICEENDYRVLDFHHLDKEEKKSNISRMISSRRSFKSIREEIEKCILVCANCHRKIHSNDLLRAD